MANMSDTAAFFLASLVSSPVSAKGPHSPGAVENDCADCPEIVIIPAGSSLIGAAEGDSLATPAERPRRTVRFWPGFAIGRREISLAEYQKFEDATQRAHTACAGLVEGRNGSGSPPAACLSLGDAQAYVSWLTLVSGRHFRLPGAAEWEYAARAGRNDPMPAVVKGANGWGVIDLGVNVAELVGDCWQGEVPLSGQTPLVKAAVLEASSTGSCPPSRHDQRGKRHG